MILYYVRHGDPIYNPDSLTELGHRQAEAVAKRLAVYGIDKIFASTSNRAILTAEPTAQLVKKEITQLDFCNEGYAWGDFTVENDDGRRTWLFHDKKTREHFMSKEIRELGEKWCEHPRYQENKKGVERIARETDAFMLSLGYRHDRERGVYEAVEPTKERVALFAHQGFGIAFLSSLLDIPYPMFATHFDMSHTGVSIIKFSEAKGTCIPCAYCLANDSHLYKEGLPTKYHNVDYI